MDRLEAGIRRGEEFNKAKGIVNRLAQRGMLCDDDVDLEILKQKAEYKNRMTVIREQWKGHKVNKKATLRPKAVIDAKSYFGFAREDPHCWTDDSFLKRYLKDNPECDLQKLVE